MSLENFLLLELVILRDRPDLHSGICRAGSQIPERALYLNIESPSNAADLLNIGTQQDAGQVLFVSSEFCNGLIPRER